MTFDQFIERGGDEETLAYALERFFSTHLYSSLNGGTALSCHDRKEVDKIFDIIEEYTSLELGFHRDAYADRTDWTHITFNGNEIHFGDYSHRGDEDFIVFTDIDEIYKGCLSGSTETDEDAIDMDSLPDIMELLC